MRRFVRKGQAVSARMTEAEVAMLGSLIRQLVELTVEALGEPSEDADPLRRLEAELQAETEPVEPPSDPVVQRLFPNPYPHDPQAAADYRRFTQAESRDALIGHAHAVLEDLSVSSAGSRPVTVTEAESWLKVLTALRLSLATRLDITDADSVAELAQLTDNDPRAYLYSVFEWLGFAQETLVECL